MRSRWLVAVFLVGVLAGWRLVHGQQDPDWTIDGFIKQYGLAPMTHEPPQPTRDKPDPPVEGAARFDENGSHAGYRYTSSIAAIRDLFLERARRQSPVPQSPREIQVAIDETFGVSRFGEGLRILQTGPASGSARARLQEVQFRFGEGGFGQAIVGRPERPNGVLLIALHGCLGSPDMVMSDQQSYANAFGLRAAEAGYTVVAPYVLGECAWIHNLDFLGTLSGVSVFGYELAKIGQLVKWARREYDVRRAVIWGISLGGQYAMLSSALYRDLFEVTVISAAAADYESSYREGFEAAGLDAGNKIGANTQAALSARFARRDVVASILPRRIVFEVSKGDLRPDVIEFIRYVDYTAQKGRAESSPFLVEIQVTTDCGHADFFRSSSLALNAWRRSGSAR